MILGNGAIGAVKWRDNCVSICHAEELNCNYRRRDTQQSSRTGKCKRLDNLTFTMAG